MPADSSRRALLRTGLAWTAASWIERQSELLAQIASEAGCTDQGPRGELLGLVPFASDRGRDTPLGEFVGGPGLDARLFTDLSDLEPGKLITPTSRVFVRTARPKLLEGSGGRWTIGLSRFTKPAASLSVDDLIRDARPMGAHLIECAGNTDPQNFGLMSVTEWDGVPLADVVARFGVTAGATGVMVKGVDDESPSSRRSTPGASWVLPLDHLDRVGAFLAVRMNGEVLPPDHGAPVRLVAPGWYGCAWIKWVNEIRLVGADEPATSQMREFAGRTHQDGVPEFAKDYQLPAIDLAATPIRIEKRRLDGRLTYRVVGIVWGGERTTDKLLIRFSARDAPKSFALCPAPTTHRMWSLWEYAWQPTEPGVYDIVLKVADPTIRTRRLDLFFYVRRVRIEEI